MKTRVAAFFFLIIFLVSGATALPECSPRTFIADTGLQPQVLHDAGTWTSSSTGVRECYPEVTQRLVHPNERGGLLRQRRLMVGLRELLFPLFSPSVVDCLQVVSIAFCPDENFLFRSLNKIPVRYPIPPPFILL